jgi:hypothetical protein
VRIYTLTALRPIRQPISVGKSTSRLPGVTGKREATTQRRDLIAKIGDIHRCVSAPNL